MSQGGRTRMVEELVSDESEQGSLAREEKMEELLSFGWR